MSLAHLAFLCAIRKKKMHPFPQVMHPWFSPPYRGQFFGVAVGRAVCFRTSAVYCWHLRFVFQELPRLPGPQLSAFLAEIKDSKSRKVLLSGPSTQRWTFPQSGVGDLHFQSVLPLLSPRLFTHPSRRLRANQGHRASRFKALLGSWAQI